MEIVIDTNEKSRLKKNTPPCPVCRARGQKVSIKTVRNLLQAGKVTYNVQAQYYLCLSQDCSVAYFTEPGAYFSKNDLTVPIWFKEKSPVPICYCKNVTDTEIFDHVVAQQCCSDIEAIQLHTGANTGNECLLKNPTGK